MMLLAPALLAAASLLSPLVPAQDRFAAIADGASVVPPTASPATAEIDFSLDPATQQAFYRIVHNVPGAIGAEVRQAFPGANGPVAIALAPAGPFEFRGVTPPMSPADRLLLFQGGFYVNIRSAAAPAGEIRGQLAKYVHRDFACDLNQANVVPPSGSPATGVAHFTLHEPENRLTYQVQVSGLLSPPTGAQLRFAPPGANGPVVVDLGAPLPATAAWAGYSPALTPPQVAALKAGNFYVSVDSILSPAGAVRGQLTGAKQSFSLRANGSQVVPPNLSPNQGRGGLIFDPATAELAYSIDWNGINGTGAILQIGYPGQPGGVLLPLAGPPNGPWIGSTPPLATATVDLLYRQGLNIEILSMAVPTGELRGSVRLNHDHYGYSGATLPAPMAGDRRLKISSEGIPSLGAPFTVELYGGMPGAAATLAYCEDLIGTPLDLLPFGVPSHVLWGNALGGYPAPPVNLHGATELNFTLPVMAALIGQDFYLQWFSVEPGANPLGLVTSDAIEVVLVP